MVYGSVCSGIEAASQAFEPLGWQAKWFAEIEKDPSAVLKFRYPNVKNLGDFTAIGENDGPVDLLIGGTPCQSFSVAGGRAGLDDPRGNLAIEFLRLALRLRARWLVWENVPGVFSSWTDFPDDTHFQRKDSTTKVQSNDFDTFLGYLSQLGYGFAYRILDAQYVGGCPLHVDEFGIGPVPQRRRRLFVVAYSGKLGPTRSSRTPSELRRLSLVSAAALFESFCLRGDSPASSTPEEGIARTSRSRSKARRGSDDLAATLGGGTHDHGGDIDGTTYVAEGHLGRQPNVAMTLNAKGGVGRMNADETLLPCEPIPFDTVQVTSKTNRNRNAPGDPCGTLTKSSKAHIAETVAFKASHYTRNKDGAPSEIAPALSADADKGDQDTLIAVFGCKDSSPSASDDIAPCLRSMSEGDSHANGGGQVAFAFQTRYFTRDNKTGGAPSEIVAPLTHDNKRGDSENLLCCFEPRVARNGRGAPSADIAPPLKAESGSTGKGDSATVLATETQVRRLTVIEAERLMGMQDNWTRVPVRKVKKPSSRKPWQYDLVGGDWFQMMADGPRYKMLGNSMVVQVMRWIGTRIDFLDKYITQNPEME